MRIGSSCWDSLNGSIKDSGRSSSRLSEHWGLSEQGPEAAGGEQSSPPSTHAHAEHLFTPMDVQGALFLLTEKEEGIWSG